MAHRVVGTVRCSYYKPFDLHAKQGLANVSMNEFNDEQTRRTMFQFVGLVTVIIVPDNMHLIS